jgi:hypothetical protein
MIAANTLSPVDSFRLVTKSIAVNVCAALLTPMSSLSLSQSLSHNPSKKEHVQCRKSKWKYHPDIILLTVNAILRYNLSGSKVNTHVKRRKEL